MTGSRATLIVVGIDDTAESTAAAVAAADLARRKGWPLRLVRALPGGAEAGRPAAAARLAAVRAAVRDVLPADVVTAVVREGPADLVLLHESRTAGLVVVGPAGAAGLGELAAALVRRAACPVLVARAAPDGGGVVVGVDGGPGTATLLSAAVDEAGVRGTSLLVLHAWDRPSGGSESVEVAVGAAERHLLEGYVQPLQEASPAVRVDLRVLHAPPAEALLQAAPAAVVLVLGRHPDTRRGGTLETVASITTGPVLVIPLDVPHRAPARRQDAALTGSG